MRLRTVFWGILHTMRHPGRWLWLLLVVPMALGFARLRLDVDVLNLLPGDLPVVQGLKLFQEHFADARQLVITVEGSEVEGTENAARWIAERLRRETNRVASALWQPPWLEHPGQAAEIIAAAWLNQPPETFSRIVRDLDPAQLPMRLAAAREELSTSMSPTEIARLSYDPLGLTRLPESAGAQSDSPFSQGQGMFASEDGLLRIVFVKAAGDLKTYVECQQWFQSVQQALSPRAFSDAGLAMPKLGFTGRPAFVTEIAGGMEKDMTNSVLATAVIIAALFWMAHRRWKPMLWLLVLLGLILGGTLGLGGLFYGSISVVSMGFAAILLGLAVDYAVVHYQEALAHPGLSIPDIRQAIAPSITWAAVTTIAAFLALNFGGLPGLGQLGALVGIGVLLAALVMIYEYLPPLFPGRENMASGPAEARPEDHAKKDAAISSPAQRRRSGVAFAFTAVLISFSASLLFSGLPGMDPTADALRPRNSPAYDTLARVKSLMNHGREPLWILATGRDEQEVRSKLTLAHNTLERAVSNGAVSSFNLPTSLWPAPTAQRSNLTHAAELADRRELLRSITLSNGFSELAFGLADAVLDTWRTAAGTVSVFWPTNDMSTWVLDRFAARTPRGLYALGLVNIPTNASVNSLALKSLASELSQDGVCFSGWELLGASVFERVKGNTWFILLPIAGLVLASLWFAFRRLAEVLLSVAVLTLSSLCLLVTMRWCGWSWNLLNLMALPLVLGTGVDYSIFMLLALRRHGGNLQVAYRSVGRALLLCGGTAVAGFGSLAFSSNAGMASLGVVCATGIAFNMVIAITLLPHWWKLTSRGGDEERGRGRAGGEAVPPPGPHPTQPSRLYRASLWKLGWKAVTVLPVGLAHAIALTLGQCYWLLVPSRRRVVVENLTPVLGGDARAARRMTRRLFRQFGIKLVDLLRYEAGHTVEDLFGPSAGFDLFLEARKTGRGVLLVTPHLGNWEFGSAYLRKQGVSLQVITMAEPGEDLTQLRQASRARREIETIVIGNDPFAFLEVIRRLESGATVALLIDRPPPPSAVTVEFFGRPFAASIAAAELARASGCVLLPVYVPRHKSGYAAHVLPPVPYDRATIRDRESRRKLTQRILRAFEPVIRQHPEQWYHFVPIWPSSPAADPESVPTRHRNPSL